MIKNILFELVPFMKEIKNTMNNFLEANLTNFNESLHQLTAHLEEHKNQTAVELAQLQTFLMDNLTHQLNDIERDITYILGPYTCGGTGGWRRVVYLNMTDPTSTCPSGWQLTGYSERTCGRASSGAGICDSATFPVDRSYTKLCGRVKAYQWGSPDAFWPYHNGFVTIALNILVSHRITI